MEAIEQARWERQQSLMKLVEKSRDMLTVKNPLLRARCHLIERSMTTKKKRATAAPGSRNRYIKRQMRFSLIMQYLRNQLPPTELAEVLADLNTTKPSKKTQTLLQDAYTVVDIATR